MIRKPIIATFVIALAFAAGIGLLKAQSTDAAGPPQIVSGFGEANIGGEKTIVHVVVVPSQSGRAVLDQALADHGARPFDSAIFTLDNLGKYITADIQGIDGIQRTMSCLAVSLA
mgnify:CR=1 FL=1